MFASRNALSQLNQLVSHTGLQLGSPLTPSTETRLSLLLTELGLDSVDTLVEGLGNEGPKGPLLQKTIGVLTHRPEQFFRDYKVFKFIRKAIFPYLAKRKPSPSPLRVLVIGDSIGTEVYSLSILADESAWGTERHIEVTGYDISKTAADFHRVGLYSAQTIAASMPSAFIKSHFQEVGDDWRIASRHHERCNFVEVHPELEWPDQHAFDLVVLRNVLAYLPESVRKEVVDELKLHLKPGSFVVCIGGAHALANDQKFKTTSVEGIHCFRYKVGASTTKTASQKSHPSGGAATQEFSSATALLRNTSKAEAPPVDEDTQLEGSFTRELGDLARKIYLFDKMPPGELDDICERVKLCAFTPGEVILAQGEMGDAFFIVKTGQVKIEIDQGKLKAPLKVAELKRGQIFGEMSLILDEPCSASVISETDVTAYLFDKSLFDYLRFENDLFAEKLDEIVLERRADNATKREAEQAKAQAAQLALKAKQKAKAQAKAKGDGTKVRTVQVAMTDKRFSSLVKHVRDVALFRNLTGRDMEMVSSRVTCWKYPEGNRLITQGHKGSAFYILNKGKVSIQIKKGLFGKKEEVAKLDAGHLFGEISLILDQKCTADVVASEDVEAFVFSKELFNFLIEQNEPFRKTIEEIAIERRAETAKKK